MQHEIASLRELVEELDGSAATAIRSATASATLRDLLDGSVLGGRTAALAGRSVLLAGLTASAATNAKTDKMDRNILFLLCFTRSAARTG